MTRVILDEQSRVREAGAGHRPRRSAPHRGDQPLSPREGVDSRHESRAASDGRAAERHLEPVTAMPRTLSARPLRAGGGRVQRAGGDTGAARSRRLAGTASPPGGSRALARPEPSRSPDGRRPRGLAAGRRDPGGRWPAAPTPVDGEGPCRDGGVGEAPRGVGAGSVECANGGRRRSPPVPGDYEMHEHLGNALLSGPGRGARVPPAGTLARRERDVSPGRRDWRFQGGPSPS